MESGEDHHHHSLTSLIVFENTINKELIRSLHVYRLNDGGEEEVVEREFLFSGDGPYVEMAANPLLRLRRFRPSDFFEGQLIGLWRCIFIFHSHTPPPPPPPPSPHSTCIPPSLLISGNSKLEAIPALANDLKLISKLSGDGEVEELPVFPSEEIQEDGREGWQKFKRCLPRLDQDLNCLPYSVAVSEVSKCQNVEQNEPDVVEKKKRRAAAEDIARIALDDLIQYFDLPIVEASRSLKVGLTVLKKRCRELGIPRWPHRKIKSIDNLIQSLQEEAERQEQEDGDAAKAVERRRRMLEREKETIERKPHIEMKIETKRFRQDVFKRRHRARALGIQGQ